MNSYYDVYFDEQIGGAQSNQLKNVYVGVPYQRGHGIGSFLGGLFRRVLPLLKRGAKALGREALRTGMNIASDMTTNNIPFKESLKSRVRETGENLKRKAEEKIDSLMEGSGYNYAKRANMLQSGLVSGGSSIHSKRKVSKKRKTIKTKKSKKKKSRKLNRRKKSTAARRKQKKKSKKRTARDIFD